MKKLGKVLVDAVCASVFASLFALLFIYVVFAGLFKNPDSVALYSVALITLTSFTGFVLYHYGRK